MSRQYYSSGFAINGNQVAVIKKNRPSWQAGRLNAIGGHAEPGERDIDTLTREFYEETGYESTIDDWRLFAILKGVDFVLNLFVSYSIPLNELKTTTDEEVLIVDIDSLNPTNSLPNVSWLVKMANTIYLDRADYFTIEEMSDLEFTRLP